MIFFIFLGVIFVAFIVFILRAAFKFIKNFDTDYYKAQERIAWNREFPDDKVEINGNYTDDGYSFRINRCMDNELIRKWKKKNPDKAYLAPPEVKED